MSTTHRIAATTVRHLTPELAQRRLEAEIMRDLAASLEAQATRLPEHSDIREMLTERAGDWRTWAQLEYPSLFRACPSATPPTATLRLAA